MARDTETEGRRLELAKARSQAGEVRAVLMAHRASSNARDHPWKVKEARYQQELEVVQSRVVSLTHPLREAPSRGLAPVAKRLERAVRSRLSRLFGRGPQTAQNVSHSRGRR